MCVKATGSLWLLQPAAVFACACRESWRLAHLRHLRRIVSCAIGKPCGTAIVPIIVGGESVTQRVARRVLESGYHVPAIRPPTVPQGTSRLRVSLSAGHSAADVLGLLGALSHAFALEELPALNATCLHAKL